MNQSVLSDSQANVNSHLIDLSILNASVGSIVGLSYIDMLRLQWNNIKNNIDFLSADITIPSVPTGCPSSASDARTELVNLKDMIEESITWEANLLMRIQTDCNNYEINDAGVAGMGSTCNTENTALFVETQSLVDYFSSTM
jgi:hypothetical protein